MPDGHAAELLFAQDDLVIALTRPYVSPSRRTFSKLRSGVKITRSVIVSVELKVSWPSLDST